MQITFLRGITNQQSKIRNPQSSYAGVAQREEALVLETRQCGFESLRRYQQEFRISDCGFRTFPLFQNQHSSKPQSEIRNPKSFGALGKPGSSRLIFNQEMRGFESHTPCQLTRMK